MKIKNFIGLSFKDAVKNAKAELGENISILESKKVDSNDSLPGAKQLIQVSVIVNADKDSPAINKSDQKKEQASLSNKQQGNFYNQQQNYRFSRDETQFLNDELAKLNQYIKKFYLPRYPENFINIYEGLIKSGVETTLAKDLIHKCFTKLDSAKRITIDDIIKEIRHQILPMLKPYHIIPNKSGPTPIALVGPSGTGKTRTIMKLATHPDFFGEMKRKIISTGNFGVGTESTLEKFSKLTDIGIELIKSPNNLKGIVKKYSKEEVLLFDTPSLNIDKSKSIKKINSNLNQIDKLITFLVIDATRDVLDAEYIYDKYSNFDIEGLIITKLDETPRIGKVLSIINKIELPLLAICEGHSIPNHIRKDFKEVIWNKLKSGIKGAN
jgi:flagellar biosynthesis protein FlhF